MRESYWRWRPPLISHGLPVPAIPRVGRAGTSGAHLVRAKTIKQVQVKVAVQQRVSITAHAHTTQVSVSVLCSLYDGALAAYLSDVAYTTRSSRRK